MFPIGILSAGMGLFGGGPDVAKLGSRQQLVATLKQLANSGSVDAWLVLGAVGRRAALPRAVTLAGLPTIEGRDYGNLPAGYFSGMWGDVYSALQSDAGAAYDAGAARYGNGGPIASQAGALGGPILQTAATPTSWPLWVWLALGAALLFLAYRFLGRK